MTIHNLFSLPWACPLSVVLVVALVAWAVGESQPNQSIHVEANADTLAVAVGGIFNGLDGLCLGVGVIIGLCLLGGLVIGALKQ